MFYIRSSDYVHPTLNGFTLLSASFYFPHPQSLAVTCPPSVSMSLTFFRFHIKWNLKSLFFFVWLISLSRMPFNYVENRFCIKLSVFFFFFFFWGGIALLLHWSESKSKSESHSVLSDSLWAHGLCPPGSSVHGILQARILEWVAIPFPRESSQSRDQTQFSCISDWFFTIWATREAQVRYFMSNVLS